jgi:hypothetical protein
MIPFTAPKDYPEMLNKIGIFTLAGGLILTWAVGHANPTINAFLFAGSLKIPVAGIDLPPLFVVPGLVVAILFRVVKLHDRVSDLLRIREHFDLHQILTPLAAGVGVATTLPLLRAYRASRDELMNKIFYRYAGSSDPKIPQHYITMALDTWTWFWIITEFELYGLIAVGLFVWSKAYTHAAVVLGLMWVGLLGMYWLERSCGGHAHTEVTLILDDPARRTEIRTALDAVPVSGS